MQNLAPSFALLVALGAPLSAQPRWANPAEYSVYIRAYAENAPGRRIELLREWESLYPKSELETMRTQMLALAYMKAGQTGNAFASATRLLRLEPEDEGALSLIVTLAPSLPNPTPDQIDLTEETAKKLLVSRPKQREVELPREATVPQQALTPEDERVSAFVRAMRSRKRKVVDVEGMRREAVERALEWVRTVRP